MARERRQASWGMGQQQWRERAEREQRATRTTGVLAPLAFFSGIVCALAKLASSSVFIGSLPTADVGRLTRWRKTRGARCRNSFL